MKFFKLLREDIEVVFERDPAARNTAEVVLTYPGVHALIFHRVSHGLWGKGFHGLARFLSALARFLTGIEIHPGAYIGRRFFIDHGMGVVIGETAQIGNDCTLYHGVTLGGTSWQKGKRHPTLGNNVIVGAGAKILGPILVGDNSRIGSNAVVNKEVPANATVVGIPGRVVKKGDGRVNKYGFDAYAATEQMPDPVARAIECMLEHMHRQDEQLERLQQVLSTLTPASPPGKVEPFACSLDDDSSPEATQKGRVGN